MRRASDNDNKNNNNNSNNLQSNASPADSTHSGRSPHHALTSCETDHVIYICLLVYLATCWFDCSCDRSTLHCLVSLRADLHMRLYPHLHRAGLHAAAAPYPEDRRALERRFPQQDHDRAAQGVAVPDSCIRWRMQMWTFSAV